MNIHIWLTRLKSISILMLVFHGSLSLAGDAPIIPKRGESLKSFLPAGYKVGVEVRSDFNGDGREDIAALLWISPNSVEARPLIIILQQADGTYRLSARTDVFTNAEDDLCGAGNNYCVPNLEAKGRSLVIGMPIGSATGYQIYENEFRLFGGAWYRTRHANYTSGHDVGCAKAEKEREDERSIEEGTSINDQTGELTEYCKFVDDDGKTIRVVQSTRRVKKTPLKSLKDAGWPDE